MDQASTVFVTKVGQEAKADFIFANHKIHDKTGNLFPKIKGIYEVWQIPTYREGVWAYFYAGPMWRVECYLLPPSKAAVLPDFYLFRICEDRAH